MNKKHTEKYKNKRSKRRLKIKKRADELKFIKTRSGKKIPRKESTAVINYDDDDVFETIIEDDTVRAVSQRLFGLYLLLAQTPSEKKPGWLFPASYSEWANIYELAEEKNLTRVMFKNEKRQFSIFTPDLYDAYVVGTIIYHHDKTIVWNKRIEWWSDCGDLAHLGTVNVYPNAILLKGNKIIYSKSKDAANLARRTITVPSLFYEDSYFIKLVSNDDDVAKVFLENFIWNTLHAYIGKEGFELVVSRKHDKITELMPLDEAMRDAYFITMKSFKDAREKQRQVRKEQNKELNI